MIFYETDIIFSRPFIRAVRKHCPMSGKQNYKNERLLRLVAHINTKISQNICLINIHSLIYRYARCDEMPFDFITFFGHFHTFYYWTFMFVLLYHHYMSNQYTKTDISSFQMSQQVRECILISFCFFANFAQNWRILMSKVLYIHQTITKCLSNQYIYFDLLMYQM